MRSVSCTLIPALTKKVFYEIRLFKVVVAGKEVSKSLIYLSDLANLFLGEGKERFQNRKAT